LEIAWHLFIPTSNIERDGEGNAKDDSKAGANKGGEDELGRMGSLDGNDYARMLSDEV